MDLTISVTNDEVEGVCGQYKRPDTVLDQNRVVIPNPISKPDFVRNVLISFVQNSHITFEANKAAEVARQSKISELRALKVGN